MDDIATDNGVDKIVSTIYKNDALSFIPIVYDELQKLLTIKLGQNQKLFSFEFRFAARLSSFNSDWESVRLSEFNIALKVLANAIDSPSQRFSIPSDASCNDIKLSCKLSVDTFIAFLSYETIANVFQQWEVDNDNQFMSSSADQISCSSEHRQHMTPK